jgi:hypothetical protein
MTAGDDRLRETRQLDDFAKDSAQHENGEIILHEADHLLHEDAGKHGWDQRRVGQEHSAKRGNRSEQDHTVAAVGNKHQKDKSAQHDQEIHSHTPFQTASQWMQGTSSS